MNEPPLPTNPFSIGSGDGGTEQANVDLTGQTLGEFVLLRRVGQGGMGQVYMAEQSSLKRKVALKILKPELAANESSLKRFRLEAEAVARATHANIVQVYTISEDRGTHFMALEYVDGFNLRDYLLKKGPPELSLALSIMRQVASALARASELGIVHRDIKPENILLTRKGEVKVADFGLTRWLSDDQQPHLTQSGVTMGTPLYMSPEQVQGQPVDPRTDIYSFGVTCYHMFSGQPPYRGESAFEVAMQHVQSTPPPLEALRPDLPPELLAVVGKMMAKEPVNRYQTAQEILHELKRLRAGLGGSGTMPAGDPLPEGPPAPASTSTRTPRPLWPVVAVPLTLLAAMLGGALAAWMLSPPRTTSTDELTRPTAPSWADEERLLRKQAAEPSADPQRAAHDFRSRLDLGLFLLQHHRLAEAEAFFQQLIDDPKAPPLEQDLGRLGRACVLAYQDRFQESNQAFLDCLERLKASAERARLLLRQPRLRKALALALERNAQACEAARQPFPSALEPLRHPLPVISAGPREPQPMR